MSQVCVFFAEGFEEIEALTVVDLLRRAGIETDMVSITGERQVTGSHGIMVRMDRLLEEIEFSSTEMLVLPGGMPGTANLEACEELMGQVEEFYHSGKYISAICAAPSILGHRGMLRGKRACCFPDREQELEGARISRNSTETDGTILTARGMGCAIDFGLAIVERFQGKEAAEMLAAKIVYC